MQKSETEQMYQRLLALQDMYALARKVAEARGKKPTTKPDEPSK